MTAPRTNFAPGSHAHGCPGADETSPAWKAGPVIDIISHLPVCLRHLPRSRVARLRAELAAVRTELDALDRGVIEAGTMAGRADCRTASLLRYMQERAAAAGLPEPDEASEKTPRPHAIITAEQRRTADALCETYAGELWTPAEREAFRNLTADGNGAS